eukprot:2209619-Pleurochrysis_carterae.AAC.1
MPGAYTVWIPASRSTVNASDVYFDETLFPWRPAERSESSRPQRDAPPLATPSVDDGQQPPGLPDVAVPATVDQSAGRRFLFLFSGPIDRPG